MPITTKRIINLDNAASVANDDYIVLDGTTNGTRKYLTSGKALSTEDYTTADKTKLAGIAAGAEVNVQSDWTEADNTSDAYIANKPSLATVATSGSYNDLSDKPTMPNLGDVHPQSSASGAIASFTDGSNLAKAVSVVADIDAVQSGSGDPSPNNIRPISGWNSVRATVAGKNIADDSQFDTSEPSWYTGEHWIGLTDNGDGTFTETRPLGWGGYGMVYVGTYPAETYTLSCDVKDVASVTCGAQFLANETGTWTEVTKQTNSSITTTGRISFTFTANKKFDLWLIVAPYTTNGANVKFGDIQVELGSTATAYEPYNSDSATYTTSLGSTYYGGTLDVVSGVLTVTHGYEIYDETATWTMTTLNNSTVFQTHRGSIPTVANFNSNMITRVSAISQSDDNVGYAGGTYLNVKMTSIASVNDLLTLLTQTPLEICYELATPTTVQLTGQEVSILLGDNNVWCDSGDNVTVTYKADIKKYVDNAIANA